MNVLKRFHKRTLSTQATPHVSNRDVPITLGRHHTDISAPRGDARTNIATHRSSRPPRFSNYADAMKEVKGGDRSTLFLIGFGVTYVPPTRQSLQYLMEFVERHDLNKQRSADPHTITQIKYFLFDEDTHPIVYDENKLVVGTPILQIFWRGSPIYLRFPQSAPATSRPSRLQDEAVFDELNTSERDSDMYIGQLHPGVLEYLVSRTLLAIDEMSRDHSNQDAPLHGSSSLPLIVEVHMSEMNPTLWSRVDMTELDEHSSSETHNHSSSMTSFDHRAEHYAETISIDSQYMITGKSNSMPPPPPTTTMTMTNNDDSHLLIKDHTDSDFTDDVTSTMEEYDDYDEDDYHDYDEEEEYSDDESN